jgi:hypothetical protein
MNYLNKKLKYFNYPKQDFIKLPRKNQIEYIEAIVEYWYLYADFFNTSLEVSVEVEPYEYSILIYDKEYPNNNKLMLSIGYPFQMEEIVQFDESYHFEHLVTSSFLNPIEADFPIKIISRPYTNIGIGYRFAIFDELQWFGNINIWAYYTLMQTDVKTENMNDEFYSFRYSFISSTESERFVYDISDIQNLSTHYGLLKMSIPVFYLWKLIHFEIGGSMEINYLEFGLTVKRKAVLVDRVGSEYFVREVLYTEELDKYSYKNSSIKFFQMVSLVFNITDFLETRIDYHKRLYERFYRLGVDIKL